MCSPTASRDLTEENLQARIRGNLLMALSNKFGWLVLTTGNKSEMSVGYSTLYGDSAGGFAVIKDVPKLLVYKLTRHRDERAGGDLVPPELFTRAPSAELRADQRDDDSLPPYEILDAILEGYVEHDLGREQLVARGLRGARTSTASSGSSTSRSTSAASSHPASRSRRGRSAATGGSRSPIDSGARRADRRGDARAVRQRARSWIRQSMRNGGSDRRGPPRKRSGPSGRRSCRTKCSWLPRRRSDAGSTTRAMHLRGGQAPRWSRSRSIRFRRAPTRIPRSPLITTPSPASAPERLRDERPQAAPRHRQRTHRDRHPRQRTQPPGVVGDLDVPDPRRPAAVAPHRDAHGSCRR